MMAHIEEIMEKILPVLKRYDVIRAAIFGSFARGEMKESSDMDILVEFGAEKSLLDLAGLHRTGRIFREKSGCPHL